MSIGVLFAVKAQISSPDGRLFRRYKDGKFTKAPIGKTVMAGIPRAIATYIGLDNAHLYTGHALRVTSATVLADNGANSLTLKRHGRWKSNAVAEEYMRDSKHTRNETAALLSGFSLAPSANKGPHQQEINTNIIFTNCVFNGPTSLHTVVPNNGDTK